MKQMLLFLVILLLSCQKKRTYQVSVSYGKGWDKAYSSINCDSVKLFNPNHARFYVDGVATDIYGERILIGNY